MTPQGEQVPPYSFGLEVLSPEDRDKAIALFREEADKPYRILTDPKNLDPHELQDCVGKSIRLHEALQQIGIETCFGVCSFNWSDALPLEVTKFSHKDQGGHIFLLYKYIQTDSATAETTEEWRVLDPTWNPGLRMILNANHWDGVHGTTCAVSPTTSIERLDPNDPADHARIYDTSWIPDDLEVNGKFYKALNAYFEWVENQYNKDPNGFVHPLLQAGYPYPNAAERFEYKPVE